MATQEYTHEYSTQAYIYTPTLVSIYFVCMPVTYQLAGVQIMHTKQRRSQKIKRTKKKIIYASKKKNKGHKRLTLQSEQDL